MSKRIVLCIDGTNNDPLKGRTNVSRFFRMLKKIPGEQIVYYQAGVGTLSQFYPGMWVLRPIKRAWDLATAYLLKKHVTAAYRFLMNEYRPGDRICFAGFSRGAYSCRVLAGMLNKVGLLFPGHEEMLNFAWKLYKPRKNFEAAGRFKKFFAQDVDIEFIGVWDTVRSTGTPWKPRFYSHTFHNAKIKVFRQALALDERRVLYPANLYGEPQHGQSISQVWFPGVHSDVGGGYTGDRDPGLGVIPLAWMVREAEAAGLVFDEGEKCRLFWKKGEKCPPNVTVEQIAKKFIPEEIHDELRKIGWKLLECLPFPRWKIGAQGKWKRAWRVHLGAPREVPGDTLIHRSVVLKNKADPGYMPKNIDFDRLPVSRIVW